MNTQAKIKNKLVRVERVLTKRPKLGLGTNVSVTKLKDGFKCETQEGGWTLKTDMPEQMGGEETAPTPGVLGRAALGSCLTIGYMLWASKMDIPIEYLEVQIEADYDDGGLMDTSNAVPGYSEIRYTINIQSNASQTSLIELLDKAEKHSPYLDVFSRAQNCIRKIKFNQ